MGYSPWDCKESDMTEQLTLSLNDHQESSMLPTKEGFYLWSNVKEDDIMQ